jgi:hypothetical protein
VTAPGRMKAVALDVDGNVIGRAQLDGSGTVTFDGLPDDRDVATVRWAGEDGVAHDYRVPTPIPFGEPVARPGAPAGDCPTCGRELALDVDPGGARFIPLHGGWPPCDGSGMSA